MILNGDYEQTKKKSRKEGENEREREKEKENEFIKRELFGKRLNVNIKTIG